MTRKDTILIAVLINAGLLIVMFVTAIKPSHLEQTRKKSELAKQKQVEANPVSTKTEIDRMLTSLPSVKEEVKPSTEKKEQPIKTVIEEKKENVAKAPSQLAEQNFTSIAVKSGDALEKIAKAHRCTVKELMEVNHLQSTKLQIGQVLYIPKASNSATPKTPLQPLQDKQTENDQYYIVKNGDNPWTIAIKNRLNVDDLLRLNNLDKEKARKLKPGDRLRIR